ncbi:hypothetical protein MMC20_003927, partial [Loxospora ochrophaea]|nr:hypothetical protein [Loxospora ochrophaea]
MASMASRLIDTEDWAAGLRIDGMFAAEADGMLAGCMLSYYDRSIARVGDGGSSDPVADDRQVGALAST